MTTTEQRQRMLRGYLKRGWAPVPIPLRSKNPGFEGWEQYRAQPEDLETRFAVGNVGLLLGEPSGGLVDVDLDSPEARHLAALFLPDTGLRHGRPSSEGSHWWYICDPIPDATRRYKHPSGDSLIELRSTGGQTVVPPSIYRNGHGDEALVWEAAGTPATVDGRVLADAVSRLAACVLLARSWPTEGSRHDAALAAAGMLLRHGWDEETAVGFVLSALRVAGDAELDDRERAIRDTADALRRGKRATGIPSLIEHIGQRQVDRLCDWLGIGPTTEPPIIQTNGQHAPVDEPDDRAWSEIITDAPVPDDLPYFAARWLDYLRPFSPMYPDGDWPLMVGFLPFWSVLWPEIKLQNLNLAIWSLGLGVQGVGKNVGTDEAERIVRGVAGQLRRDLTVYTAGSPEGMWDRLGGVGKQMLCYHDEYGGFLKLLQRDHMSHAREALCSLYDGRVVGYLRAQKGGSTIVDPLVAVAATTNAASIRAHATWQDMTSGYLSRFLVCAPNPVSVSPDYYPSDGRPREEIIGEVERHLYKLRDVQRLEWDGTGRADPPRLNEYREFLGMNTGEIIDLDTRQDDAAVPPGRLVARAKKTAGLLELAERNPLRSKDGTIVYVRGEHLESALDIVERSRAYALRMQGWVGQSGDYELSRRVLRILAQTPEGITQREITRRTHARYQEIRVALEMLENAGQARCTKQGKALKWYV